MSFRPTCKVAALSASVVLFAAAATGLPLQAGPVAVNGLASIFEPGPILEDTNGDGLTDFVATRIVLPDAPQPGDVAAAVAVAARLGLETSGLSLPLVYQAADVAAPLQGSTAILIGASNPHLPAAVASRAEQLDEGEGVVAFVDGAVVIAGKDDAGTQAAGEAFSSRSPFVWEVISREEGDTFQRIAGDAAGLLAQGGVAVSEVSFDELLYRSKGQDAASVVVTASVDAGNVGRARDLLEALYQRHRRGRDTDRLNYASAAQVVYRITDGTDTSEVTIPRVGVPGNFLNLPRREPSRFERPGGRGGRGGRGGFGGAAAAGRGSRGRVFDLSQIFLANDGIYDDEDGDGIADDTDMMIVFPGEAETGDYASVGVAQLGARIGLESVGISLPILGLDRELEDPEAESRPFVVIGRENELTRELRRIGKLREDEAAAGVGRIEVVPDAFNGNSAVVVTGGDVAGEEAAAEYLSHRVPYTWDIGRAETRLSDVKDSVRKLLEGRTTAAQAALAVDELEQIVDDLEGRDIESITVDAYFEEASEGFETWAAAELARRLGEVDIEVNSHERMAPVQVFEQRPELEWEVDGFWELFRERVLPSVESSSDVSLELRVSEAPELRRQLADQIRSEIEGAGGRAGDIRVLSAYKQGLSWLTDVILPELRGHQVATIEIGWQPFPIDVDSDERFQNEPARWLNELYPADDLLARELGLPLDALSFYMDETGTDIYRVRALDAAGDVLVEDSFSPAIYERPYFDAFPDYATVTVATGWLKASVGGSTVVDERLLTDSDRIWDHYQSETLAEVYRHIRQTTGNRPTADKAPYFHTLRIELQASEPDYRLGIDEEHISVLESLHDEFYFDSLDFFYQVAEEAAEDDDVPSRSLAAGNVLPWIHPERRGQAPELTITYSAFASKEPKLVVEYREPEAEEEETVTRRLLPERLPEPFVYLAEARAGADRLQRLGLLVSLEETDPLPRLARLLDNLTRLQSAGSFEDAFGFRGVAEVSVRLEAPGAISTRTYESLPREVPATPAEPYPGRRIVTWDHVISPDESERISHTLGTLPNVTTYVAGHSYQGRPVSVMEIKLPMEAELVSQAKLNAWKPVLSIVGRQHANEVSSTSHILRLAELLATDPDYQRYLMRMNVVLQPVVNPDGAALAYELQKLTPTHCLHAGRYSALGPDVPGQANNPDTLLTEALVMRRVRERWVADVSLNPHGYPSHEWVHQFANYNPKSFRSYWIPRGWYTSERPSTDPRLDDYRRVSRVMMDYIAEEVSRDPEVRETNLRIYDRYHRWTIRWQPHLYNLDVYRDTAIYHRQRRGTTSFASPDDMVAPTVFSGGTEAMDETAQGAWLDLVTRMGFGYLMASVRFLDESEYSLYRMEGETGVGVRIAITRPRPIQPGRAPVELTEGQQ